MLSDIEKGYIIDKTFNESEEKINCMFDSRRFDAIVKGAIIVTMQNLNCYNSNDIEDVIYELEHGTLVQYDAEQLRKAKIIEC